MRRQSLTTHNPDALGFGDLFCEFVPGFLVELNLFLVSVTAAFCLFVLRDDERQTHALWYG